MIRITKYIHILLASFVIDILLLRLKNNKVIFVQISTYEEILDEAEQERKKHEVEQRVFKPVYYQSIKNKYRSKLHYLSTKSRNVRDLDQRKIRRKCNNI